MKKVVVSGTPYEQGVQEGKAFQKLIHQNVQLVREDLEKSHLNMDKYNELCLLYTSQTETIQI